MLAAILFTVSSLCVIACVVCVLYALNYLQRCRELVEHTQTLYTRLVDVENALDKLRISLRKLHGEFHRTKRGSGDVDELEHDDPSQTAPPKMDRDELRRQYLNGPTLSGVR